MAPPHAVTFDVGQCLLGFDGDFLARKLAERGLSIDPRAAEAAMDEGYRAYGAALKDGGHGGGAWKVFVRTVIRAAGEEPAEALLDWLYEDQRDRNLWQKPISGMIELARELRAIGVPVAIVSNSEGHLDKLFARLGYVGDFAVVADSGVLGFEKPGAAIFEWAAARLSTTTDRLVHIGDSWAADVEGALGVGAQAIWFPAVDARALPAGVTAARTAAEVRAALRALGVPLG